MVQDVDGVAFGAWVAYFPFGFHSRASRCASAIWAGVICWARASRASAALSSPLCCPEVVPHVGLEKVLEHASPLCIHHPSFAKARLSSCSAARLNQTNAIWALCGAPFPSRYNVPRLSLGSCVPLHRGLFKPLLRLN